MKILSKAIKMPRHKQENPSAKAKQSRLYRLQLKQQRRFEAPLRQFVETKYKMIFEEYVELYHRLNTQYPKRLDLRKTEMFKQWKLVNNQTDTDILTLAIRETIENRTEQNGSEQSEDQTVDQSESEQSEDQAVDQSQSEQSEDETAEQSESEQSEDQPVDQNEPVQAETDLGPLVDQREPDEGLLAAQHLDDLVNEMMRDEQLGALLNTENQDDEGIELGFFDELDFEPFDFRLEVELGEW